MRTHVFLVFLVFLRHFIIDPSRSCRLHVVSIQCRVADKTLTRAFFYYCPPTKYKLGTYVCINRNHEVDGIDTRVHNLNLMSSAMW